MRCAGSHTVPAQQSCIFVPDAHARPWARFKFVPGRHCRTCRLLRLLITSHEVWESYLRTVCSSSHGRRPPPSTDLVEVVQAEIRDLVSVANRLGLSETEPEASVPAVRSGMLPANDKILLVYGRNVEAKEKVARFLMKR